MKGSINVRRALPADAQGVIDHVLAVIDEAPGLLATARDEFTITAEQERQFLATTNASENSLFLVAETQGQIVGTLGCTGGARKSDRHVARLGMSVRRAWHGKGIGTALIEAARQWASQTGIIRRIELLVVADNVRAIRLYEKTGFSHEGIRRAAYRRGDEFVDEIMMATAMFAAS